MDQLTGHLERYRRIMNPRSEITDRVADEIEEEHRLLMENAIDRNIGKALSILADHRRRTYSAIKNEFAQRTAKNNASTHA